MKITVKEFVKLDIQGLMKVNGGTSACGNYSQTQPANPPSGGNDSPSNNGGNTGGSGNNNGSDTPSSYTPSYGSTTGTSTGGCGGTKTPTLPPENPPASGDNPAKDDLGGENNLSPDNGTKVSTGGCSSLNGGSNNNDDSDTTNQTFNIGAGSWGDVDSNSTMQDEYNRDKDLNNPDYVPDSDIMNGEYINEDGEKESYRFSKVGCKMEGASQIASEITGSDVSITDVNNNYDTNKDGLLTQQEISNCISSNLKEGQSLKIDYYELTLSAETVRTIAASSEGTTYVLGRAEDVAGGQHWVVLEGYSINERGQVEFTYNATSSNDIKNNRVYILGDVDSDQTNTYKISKIETYTVTSSVVGCELQ